MGGLAIIFGFGFPLLLLAGNSHAAELVSKNLSYLFAVLATGSLIVGLGVYDDLLGSNAPKKFLAQTAAAIILVSFGFHFGSISIAGFTIRPRHHRLARLDRLDRRRDQRHELHRRHRLAGHARGDHHRHRLRRHRLLRRDVFSLVIMTALAGSLIGFYPLEPAAGENLHGRHRQPLHRPAAGGMLHRPSDQIADRADRRRPDARTRAAGDRHADRDEAALRRRSRRLGARIVRMFNADRRHFHHILVESYGSIGKAILSIWLDHRPLRGRRR